MSDFGLVAFDVDGTLVEHPTDKTVWEVLNARFAGGDQINRERLEAYREGRLTYSQWVDLDVGAWQAAGATRHEMVEAISCLRLVRGSRETLRRLKSRGVHLAVISGTLDLVIETLFPDHPFDEIYTNRIAFGDGGRIAGWTATPFDMEGKGIALAAIAAREGIPLSRCAFVGDHANDLSAARLAGFTIAFNPKSPELEAIAAVVVRSDDLKEILPHLID